MTDQLAKDVAFLRRRQGWLESRIKDGGLKSYDVREAKALDRILSLVEQALAKACQ